MKHFHFLLIALLVLACQKDKPTPKICELPDVGAIGSICDSLYAAEEYTQAARLYFKGGIQNQSSELFVYSAWMYGQAQEADSALMAIKNAISFGMSNPYILDKVGIAAEAGNDGLRKEVHHLLDSLESINSSIDNFEVINTTTNDFWEYFEKAKADTANAKMYLAQYICEGSNALKDYYHIRYENVDKMHRNLILKYSDYYTYVKSILTQDRLQKVAEESKEMMLQFSKIYPPTTFPKTYLVPDLINSSGTLSELGLFIGISMFAKSDSMPLKNLDDWQKTHISEFENMNFVLIHELMHFQQSYSDDKNRNILLGKLIEEGVCDFLVTLLTPKNAVSPDMQRRLDYLATEENENFILEELKRDLYSGDLSKWMYNGGAISDRPSDMGYTMGYLICKSYYEQSTDKKQAVFELLNTSNFKSIIENSEYSSLL